MHLWDLDEETVAVFRQGTALVLEQLGKQMKEVEKAPQLGHAHRMRELITSQITVATDAGRLLYDQADLEAQASIRVRRAAERPDPAQEANTISAEDAVKEAEREARRIRHAKVRAALRQLLPKVEEFVLEGLHTGDQKAIAEYDQALQARLEDVQHTDQSGKEWAGLFLYEELAAPVEGEEEPTVVESHWCIVHTEPRAFFFGIAAPDEFNPLEAVPDLKSDEVGEVARALALEEYLALRDHSDEVAEDALVVFMNAAGTTTTDPVTGENYAIDFATAEGYRIIPHGQEFAGWTRLEDDTFRWAGDSEEEEPASDEDSADDGPFGSVDSVENSTDDVDDSQGAGDTLATGEAGAHDVPADADEGADAEDNDDPDVIEIDQKTMKRKERGKKKRRPARK